MTDHPDLPVERARNAEYLGELARKLERRIEIGMRRNAAWVDPGRVGLNISGDDLLPLVGRVGLDTAIEDIGTSFYVGPRRLEFNGISVVSWSADVAALYFQPDSNTFEGSEVVVRRTFDVRVQDLVAADDEWAREVDVSPFAAAELKIPEAPSTPRRRSRIADPRAEAAGKVPPESGTPAVAGVDSPSMDEPDRREDRPDQPDSNIQRSSATKTTGRDVSKIQAAAPSGMRAVAAVRRKLAAPRTLRLSSVLATLQPDQHELATLDPNEDLVIQGHPGTGKTIIAAYRAAFLADCYEANHVQGRILIVGPTPEYVNHVAVIVGQHDLAGRVTVTDLETLQSGYVGGKHEWSGGLAGRFDDVDARTRGLCEKAAHAVRDLARVQDRKGPRDRWVRSVYVALRSNGRQVGNGSSDPLTASVAERRWLDALPPFEEASSQRRYLPLLAQCALAIQAPQPSERFDHIIVDEAQDVSPIEWNVLDSTLTKLGRWTLVGDMNQRRSDTTYESWQGIVDHLGVGTGDADFEPRVISRGYRSTQQILEFADRLLPRAQRGVEAIQTDGPEVTKIWTRTAEKLLLTAVETAVDLHHEYKAGTTALIAAQPKALTEFMGKAGWRRNGKTARWTLGEDELHVYGPTSARGLEFDAVVVVEPSQFKQHVGKAGQLYTSLTRANRELAVVWQKDLPQPLR